MLQYNARERNVSPFIAGITNEIHIPAAQGGPRGGAVMDLRTGKWKMASTPLFPPSVGDYEQESACKDPLCRAPSMVTKRFLLF